MAYIGKVPSAVPITSADLADSIITSAKIANDAVVTGKIADGTIALADLSATGTASASTFLRGDNSWGTVSSDYVLLATQTVSGTATAISFDGYFSSTYDAYKCVFYNLDLTANSQNILIRFRVSNADVTSDYRWANGVTASINSSGTANASNSTGTWSGATSIAQINWEPVGTTLGDYICQGELTFLKPLDTSSYKMVKTDFIYHSSDDAHAQHVTGFGTNNNNASALSGFTIYPNTASFNGGTFKLYGIK
jgi:hypothetical protein